MTDQAMMQQMVKARDYNRMIHYPNHPTPGEYVITGPQFGNLHGEQGWQHYVGYVVQVRKNAGAYGTHLILLRHPDGFLRAHHNQSFHRMDKYWKEKLESLFGECRPENEDYSQPYDIGGESAEFGPVVEAREDIQLPDPGLLMTITVEKEDGSKIVEVV